MTSRMIKNSGTRRQGRVTARLPVRILSQPSQVEQRMKWVCLFVVTFRKILKSWGCGSTDRAYLACTNFWVRSPIPHNPGVRLMSLWTWRGGGKRTRNSRSALATQWVGTRPCFLKIKIINQQMNLKSNYLSCIPSQKLHWKSWSVEIRQWAKKEGEMESEMREVRILRNSAKERAEH